MRRKKRNITLFAILLMLILLSFCFVNLGSALVYDESPKDADAIVVLMDQFLIE